MNNTKRQFLDNMERLLAGLPESERARLISYLSEAIDDRVEEGVSEEEAVAALGDPEALARELLEGCDAPPRQDDSGERIVVNAHSLAETVTRLTADVFGGVKDAVNGEAANTPDGEAAGDGALDIASLDELRIKLISADLCVHHAPLGNGAAVQVRLSEPEAFTVETQTSESGSRLVISENSASASNRREFRLGRLSLSIPPLGFTLGKPRTVTVLVADALPGSLTVENQGGDIALEGLEVRGTTTMTSESGDIRLKQCTFARLAANSKSGDVKAEDISAGTADLHSVSGDVKAKNAKLGDAALYSTSGDISAKRVTAGILELRATSGDAELEDVRAEGAAMQCTSGDIDGSDVRVTGTLSVEVVSGDVTLREFESGALAARTKAGDIELDRGATGVAEVRSTLAGEVRLSELACDASLTVESSTGDVNIARCVARETRVTTSLGDVKLLLPPLPCGYDLSADTRLGEISLPRDGLRGDGSAERHTVRVKTSTGDISVKLAED